MKFHKAAFTIIRFTTFRQSKQTHLQTVTVSFGASVCPSVCVCEYIVHYKNVGSILMLMVKQSILLKELFYVVLSNCRLPSPIKHFFKSRILLLKIPNSRLVSTRHSLINLKRVDSFNKGSAFNSTSCVTAFIS